MSIIVRNLNFIYNPKTPFAKHAVKNVSLNIEDGDFFGIIGHTGSGKSTLVQHFNALIKPQDGEVIINGINPADKKADLKLIRSQVGMVFQYPEYQLFAETVYEDVAFGLRNFQKSRYTKKELKSINKEALERETEQSVREALEMVGLEYAKVKDKSPFDLSGGQKRRAAIAGVIVTKPKILILDEPTAGLDPRGKKEIIALIHRLQKSCSPTVVMISHDMNEVAQNCKKIAVIKDGGIVCVKPPKELFSDYKLIENTGLDLPEAVRLKKMLEEKGYKIEGTPFSPEETANALYNLLNAKKEGAANA